MKKDVFKVSICGGVGRTGDPKKKKTDLKGFFCFDIRIDSQKLYRYICQRKKSDCQKSRKSAFVSMKKAYAQQGKRPKLAMGKCAYSKRAAYCSLWDNGYFCAGEERVCILSTRLAIQSGRIKKVTGCSLWR